MTATLPSLAALSVAHTISDTEWGQLLSTIKGLSNIKTANFYGTMSVSTSSASYTSIAGASLSSFQKLASSSDVLIIMAMSSFAGAANAALNYGINDGTTDWQMIAQVHNIASKHNSSLGWGKLTSLSAGTYTFQARIKSNGTITLTIDNNDCGFIIAIEVPN